MQAFVSVIIFILGSIGILIALFFGLQALSLHREARREAYGFGQLRNKRSMQKYLVWAALSLIVGLVFLGIDSFLSAGTEAAAPELTPTMAVETPESEPVMAAETPAGSEQDVPPAANSPTPVPFPESQVTVLPSVTPIPTDPPAPTDTPEPELQTAVVASGVGVYLRQEPSTSAPDLEWLLDGTSLTVLPERTDADGYTWVLVRTTDGIEGWVATDFIKIAP
ncbi:MAG: hypothetical protein CSA11_09435 [Chloroflexi bacterium]|nr:MAG: hypothetical protein CSA11_09435 [Chloroflexota bacterium]